MYKTQSILAVITARGGSSRLPGKNIKSIGGKPMIAWTVEAGKNSTYLDRVIVSTDTDDIASVSKQYGADIPFMRPSELATDKASSVDVVLHAIEWLKKNEGKEYDYIMLLQPTSPLRTSVHIDKAIEELMASGKFDSLISFYEWEKRSEWVHTCNAEGFLESCLTVKSNFSEDNKLKLFIPNGAIYLTKTKTFLEEKTFYSKKLGGYIMKATDSVDIDTEEDFKMTSLLMEQRLT